VKTPGDLRQKIFQFAAVIYRSVMLKFCDALRKLAPRSSVILVVEMIKTDGDVNYSLKERSIFSGPLLPNFLYNVVAYEKVAAVEQLNALLEFFLLQKYSKFRLKFQLKNLSKENSITLYRKRRQGH
jgi:hypothetical protein